MGKNFKLEIAFLDLSMPGLSGEELAHQLRNLFSQQQLTLIAVSGHTPQSVHEQSSIFEGYLLKPLELSTLVELLNSLKKKQTSP